MRYPLTNYAVPPGIMPNPQMMESMVAGNLDIQARYRFFFRDLTLLLNADPELAAAYQANRAAGIGNTKFLLNLFAEAGVLTPLGDEAALDDLAQLLWLVGDFWLVFKIPAGLSSARPTRTRAFDCFGASSPPNSKEY